MDIKQLEVFVSVVDCSSFSKAGDKLHLAQPTISGQVASLEQEMKTQLLIRATKEIYPTEAGKLLYTHAKVILEARDQAVREMETFSREMRGRITVAASTIPGEYHIPKMLQSFRKSYPDVTFDIQMMDSMEVIHRVSNRAVDVGFTGTTIDAPRCLFKEFANDRLVVITPNEKRYQKYTATGFPMKQILSEPFIMREEGSGTRLETEQFLKEMSIDPQKLNGVVTVRNTESIKKMVSEGVGISVISKSACEDYCQFKKILAFDFENVPLRRKLYIVKNRKSVLSATVQAFYEYAKEFYFKKG